MAQATEPADPERQHKRHMGVVGFSLRGSDRDGAVVTAPQELAVQSRTSPAPSRSSRGGGGCG
jgi:hypothetical protein